MAKAEPAGGRRPRRLSAAAARRLAIAAQDLDGARDGPVSQTDIVRFVRRQGVLQIDSVNVLARAHLLPIYSRLGAFAPDDLMTAAEGRRRRLFEYWGHEASFLPVESQPLFHWRMEDARAGIGLYGGLRRYAAECGDEIAAVRARIAAEGPLAASDFDSPPRAPGGAAWWGWTGPKRALEWLFWTGTVTTHARRGNFERVYGLTESSLPARIASASTPTRAEAQRTLLTQAARRLGVATAADLRDYFRLPAADAPLRIAELVEEGVLQPAAVEGWDAPAFLDASARVPRALNRAPAALLAPFDPLVWYRERAERLFGFHYRIEIYVPEAKRRFGYYVLPFLEGDRLTARCCLKADRAASRLLVRTAHGEAGIDRGRTAEALAGELRRMAGWLGLDAISVAPVGDLASPLADALARA
ncbi:MAG: crosslink repair DNA glycosylase YcaQ family protein [Pseudomonadota bacterium]